jgi:hypothetical protein
VHTAGVNSDILPLTPGLRLRGRNDNLAEIIYILLSEKVLLTVYIFYRENFAPVSRRIHSQFLDENYGLMPRSLIAIRKNAAPPDFFPAA